MTLPIEIAQLPTLDTVQSTTRLLVQDGVTGTPYQQTTVGKVFLDLVDEIGTGTIVAGDVVISGGTADLDLLIAAEGTITDATIIGGTGTFATGSISTLTVAGTLTAGTIAATTINAGTVDISSGKATLATAVVTTGTVGTLTSTTGTITTLNAGTITIGTGTGTLTAVSVTGTLDVGVGNVTTANIGTVDISSGTAALQTLTADSGTITALSAPTLAVSGTATVGHVAATSVTASGAIVGASGTITTVNAGTVAVAGNVSAATGTITDLSSTTLAATGTATIGHAAATSATVGTLVASAGTVTLESATITDAVVSKGTIATLIANAGTVSLSKGTITDLATGTVSVSGTATISNIAGTVINAGTITSSGAVSGASGTFTTGTIPTLGVSGTATVGHVIGTTGTIASLTSTTLAATGTATIGHVIGTTGTITTGTVGTLTSTSGTIGTIVANAGTVTLGKATIDELTSTIVNAGTAIVAGGTTTSSIIPDFAKTWQDPDGNAAGGITDTGRFVWETVELAGDVMIRPKLVPGYSDVWEDKAGNVAVGIRDTGELEVDTAIIAGSTRRARSLIIGNVETWEDGDGNVAGLVDETGSLEFYSARITNLTVTNLVSGESSGSVSQLTPDVENLAMDPQGNVASVLDLAGITDLVPRHNIITRGQLQTARPTLLHSTTPPVTAPDASLASGTTIATLWSFRLPFDYVRVVFGLQVSSPTTVSFAIAPTARPNDGVNPLDGADDPVAFMDGLFNNAGAHELEPWNQNTGSTNSILLNQSSETQVWAMTYSDWAQCSSLPRSDGGQYPLLMVRAYLTGTPYAAAIVGTNVFGLTPTVYNYGREWAGYTASGDYVSSTGGYPSSGTSFGNRWAPLFIQTYSRQFGFQVFGCGDSNMAGTGDVSLLGFYRRSCLIAGRRAAVISANFNQPGSSPGIFMPNVTRILDAVRPSGVVTFPFSYNAAATEANLNLYWAQALAQAHHLMTLGGVPFWIGYPPRDGATADEDAVRKVGLSRFPAMAASGMRAIDPSVFVDAGGSPSTWVSGMTPDGTHFSPRGHAAVSSLLAPSMTEAFGL